MQVLNKKDFYELVALFIKTGVAVVFGEFDIYIKLASGDKIQITHQLNGEDWQNCESTLEDWQKKQIIKYNKSGDSIIIASTIIK